MSKRTILFLILGLLLIYPLISFAGLFQAFDTSKIDVVQGKIRNYQLSIWISWIIFASVAVYYKWITEKNLFFSITYGFLVIGFGIFGIYFQKMVNSFNLASTFEDHYTWGILAILQNLVVAVVLTVFLQISVWWFTRRFHRR